MNPNQSQAGRFVVLFHEVLAQPSDENRVLEIGAKELRQRGSHWDFMLEHNGVLEAWALDGPPAPKTTRLAQKLPPHRMEYLTYEGPVSGDRGKVTQIISGNFVGSLSALEWEESFSLNLCWEGQNTTVHFTRAKGDHWQISFGSFSVV